MSVRVFWRSWNARLLHLQPRPHSWLACSRPCPDQVSRRPSSRSCTSLLSKVAEKEVYDHDEGTSDFNTDVVRIHVQHGRTDVDQVSALMRADSQWDFVGML